MPQLTNDESYVVKRFFKLRETSGIEASQISVASFTPRDHNPQIEAECIRLARGARFLAAFYKFCDEKGVNVFRCTSFTAYLSPSASQSNKFDLIHGYYFRSSLCGVIFIAGDWASISCIWNGQRRVGALLVR